MDGIFRSDMSLEGSGGRRGGPSWPAMECLTPLMLGEAGSWGIPPSPGTPDPGHHAAGWSESSQPYAGPEPVGRGPGPVGEGP